MKFIHAADLHIDSPLRGLDRYDGAPTERIRGATRQAFGALVDLALAERVAFVLLAGDVYDGNWTDFRTGLFFRDQLLRLARENIPVFIVRGNHDAESQITRQLPAVPGVHVFSARKSETVRLDALGVAVHGRSFPERAVDEDLVPGYPAPVPGYFNIGLLHTSLTGRAGHDRYAPTTLAALCDKGYDYFALGHVHAHEVVREAAPRIVFPGNLQGRHANETGAKGCELVTLEAGAIRATRFVALDVVRWHHLRLDASPLDGVDAFAHAVAREARSTAAGAHERLHALRLTVHGESPLHRIEAAQPGTIAAAARAAAQQIDEFDLWIEDVRLELRSPLDRAALRARDDAPGEVLRLVDALTADPAALRDWFARSLAELRTLPAALDDADWRALDDAALRALLTDAEGSVLALLADAASEAPACGSSGAGGALREASDAARADGNDAEADGARQEKEDARA